MEFLLFFATCFAIYVAASGWIRVCLIASFFIWSLVSFLLDNFPDCLCTFMEAPSAYIEFFTVVFCGVLCRCGGSGTRGSGEEGCCHNVWW